MDISVPLGFVLSTKDSSKISIDAECCVCGEDHETEKCSIFDRLTHVKDVEVPPRALLTLPQGLRFEILADGTKTIIAGKCFTNGTQFGPYVAKKLYGIDPFNTFPLKIFGDIETNPPTPDCYLDTTDEEHCNWLCYVTTASNFEEQNLICYQLKNEIFYSAIRDIQPGEQLKVWYSAYYASKIGFKIYSPKTDTACDFFENAENFQDIVENLPGEKINSLENKEDTEKLKEIVEKLSLEKLGIPKNKHSWNCKFCNINETNFVKFAKHLQNHYKDMLKIFFKCDACNKSYSSKKVLLLHICEKHSVNENHPESDGSNSISELTRDKFKSESCAPLPIDNLINETLADSDPNLLMLDSLNTGLYNDLNDVDALRAILCDDNTKASKMAQEKSIADFSLELVENNHISKKQLQMPPYTCDICSKTVYNLESMYQHLSKHTGEFACLQCSEVFTRKENFIRHPCQMKLTNAETYKCQYCDKVFLQVKYLRRHMKIHTTNKNSNEQKSESSVMYSCDKCNKTFQKKAYLQKHIKTVHEKISTNNNNTNINNNNNTSSSNNNENKKPVVCEICAETFKSVKLLNLHISLHSEPKFECHICNKKFYKSYVYQHHLLTHNNNLTVTCELCSKSFKSNKALYSHMKTHKTSFPCSECDEIFTDRSCYEKHQAEHDDKNSIFICTVCNRNFKTSSLLYKHQNNEHNGQYSCTQCDKKFAKNQLLKNHVDFVHEGKVYVCKYCTGSSFKLRSSLRRHLNRCHQDTKDDWYDPKKIDTFIVEQLKTTTITSISTTTTITAITNAAVTTTTTATSSASATTTVIESDTSNATITHDQLNNNNKKNINDVEVNQQVPEMIETNKLKLNTITGNCQMIQTETDGNTVLLSLPETNDIELNDFPDQEIILGKDAFVLKDGTIVQPQPNGQFSFYITK